MVKGMILAAGRGKRMRPITNTLPKPLISIAGRSMLDRAFKHLENVGITDIVVNAHHLAPRLMEHVQTFYPTARVSLEPILLETGGGIKNALTLLGQKPFFVLNGDNIWSNAESLNEMKEKWEAEKMDAFLLLTPREKAYGYKGIGDFSMDDQGRLYRPQEGRETKQMYVYIGAQILKPELFHSAPFGAFSMNLLYDQALNKGRLYGHVHTGKWFHISTPEDIKKYEPLIATLERNENGVKVFSNI